MKKNKKKNSKNHRNRKKDAKPVNEAMKCGAILEEVPEKLCLVFRGSRFNLQMLTLKRNRGVTRHLQCNP